MAQTQQVQIGEKLGSFKIESVLGTGAMGVVYRGTNQKTGRAAAVKVVSGEITQGKKVLERFEREAEILQQFRHPNIVRFLAVGRYKGTSYIAMEFVEGVTLEKVLQERGALPWRDAVELSIQVCDALHYAHEHGVVHRDLKPSNLMVTPDGKIKLTDFGIAKDLDATALTATGRTLGTAAYMAPEQIRGTPAVSHKTDLYALGVVLYQMLTGKPPFDGTTPVVLMHCHLNEPPPRPSARVEEIPKALDELVVKLMAKAPGDRPWDAAAVGVSLSELRDKASRGASIKMAWPTPDSSAANPLRAGAAPGAETAPPERRRKKARKSGFTSTFGSLIGSRYTAESDAESSWPSRAFLETAVLVLALLVIGGFIGYWVWPPSAKYFYHQAESLMASNRRADWRTAIEDYLDPLDERYPNHPYREQTRAWRDKFLLEEVEGRANVLGSKVKTSFSEPQDRIEEMFVVHNAVAETASERGDDLAAIRQWEDLANQIKADDPNQRKWWLLARKRVSSLQNEISLRHEYVKKQLAMIEEAYRAGRANEAETIKAKLAEQYGKYTDLADLFGTPPAGQKPEANQPSPAAPPTAAPGKTPSEPPVDSPERAKAPVPSPPEEKEKSSNTSAPNSVVNE